MRSMRNGKQHLLKRLGSSILSADAFASVFAAALLASPSLAGGADAEAFAVAIGLSDTLDRLGENYVANFTVTQYAPAVPSRRPQVRQGTIARSGIHIRYSLTCPSESTIANASIEDIANIPCQDEHVLIADEILLRYSPILKIINICSTPETNRATLLTPLTMGFTGPGGERSFMSLVDRLEAGDIASTSIKFLGRTGLKWSFRCQSTETASNGYKWKSLVDWSFDESKGFLATEAIVYESSDIWVARFNVNEFKEVKTGVFWPWVSEIRENPQLSDPPGRVVVETVSVSFDSTTIQDSLDIEIPAGTRAVELTDMRSWFPFKDNRIKPSDARALVDRSERALKRRLDRTERTSQSRHESRIESKLPALYAAGIVLIVLLIATAIAVASVRNHRISQ